MPAPVAPRPSVARAWRRAAAIAVGSCALLAALPAGALADPALSGPTPASVAASRPVFSFVENPGESVEVLYVAKAAAVDEKGEFVTGNIVVQELIDDAATTFRDQEALPAGSYWWQVRWETYDPFVDHYSAAQAFVVPAYVKAAKIAAPTQYAPIPSIYLAVSYATNAPKVTVKCTVFNGTKVVSRVTLPAAAPTTGPRTTSYCNLSVPEALDGKTLRAHAEIRGAGKVGTVSRTFVAK